MTVIDCTLTVENSEMWHEYPRSVIYGAANIPTRVDRALTEVDENGDGARVTEVQTTTHSFTHIDAPRHWGLDGTPVDEIDPNKLVGDATVFDLSHKEAGELVTRDELEEIDAPLTEGDIAIIRTDWTDEAWGTKRFWGEMIGLSPDAGEWLLEHGIEGLALDFYHDPRPAAYCEECGNLKPEFPEHENHQRLLYENEVLFYENCTNFGAIDDQRVKFIAAPMKLKGVDGAPLRVMVEE